MTSANGKAGGDFDERLAQALDAALYDGEQVTARETGDQGQAIALTKSRIIVLKAGLAATGELGGHKVSPFALESVTSINLRKGPLGAVIQICTENGATSPQNGSPDNVVVFTGPGRVKRAEAFAGVVESTTGKPINRGGQSGAPQAAASTEEVAAPAVAEQVVAPAQEASASVEPATAEVVDAVEQAAAPAEEIPAPEQFEQPRQGRKRRTLAEELYGEIMDAQNASEPELSARAETGPQPAAPAPAYASSEATPVQEPVIEAAAHRPNPKLPKPVRRNKRSPFAVLVPLGTLGVLVLIGMAIMGPLNDAQKPQSLPAQPSYACLDARAAASRLSTLIAYSKRISGPIAQARAEGAACRSAISSGNRAALSSIGAAGKTDAAWTAVNSTVAPPGLGEAKENLLSGLLAQRNAITAASSAAQGSGSLTAAGALSRLSEASSRISRGLQEISAAQRSLEKQARKVPA